MLLSENLVLGKALLSPKVIYFMLLIIGITVIIATILVLYFLNSFTKNSVTIKESSELKPYSSSFENISDDIFVDISGAISKPGIYKLKQGARIADLVDLAGGPAPSQADPVWFFKNVNLAKILKDEQKLYIPFEWEVYESTMSIADLSEFPILTDANNDIVSQTVKQTEQSKSSADSNKIEQKDTSQMLNSNVHTAQFKVNVNTASASEIEELPGIGPTYANRIIQNRPYKSIEELENKAKIPNSTITKIKDVINF
jgi:competence protein ComEA